MHIKYFYFIFVNFTTAKSIIIIAVSKVVVIVKVAFVTVKVTFSILQLVFIKPSINCKNICNLKTIFVYIIIKDFKKQIIQAKLL